MALRHPAWHGAAQRAIRTESGSGSEFATPFPWQVPYRPAGVRRAPFGPGLGAALPSSPLGREVRGAAGPGERAAFVLQVYPAG